MRLAFWRAGKDKAVVDRAIAKPAPAVEKPAAAKAPIAKPAVAKPAVAKQVAAPEAGDLIGSAIEKYVAAKREIAPQVEGRITAR